MIWMMNGDVEAADGMVMFSLSVLHIQYVDYAWRKTQGQAKVFLLTI